MYAVLLTQYVFVPQCYGLNFLDMQFKPQKVNQGQRYGVLKKKKCVLNVANFTAFGCRACVRPHATKEPSSPKSSVGVYMAYEMKSL